jgi:hypothetical protein
MDYRRNRMHVQVGAIFPRVGTIPCGCPGWVRPCVLQPGQPQGIVPTRVGENMHLYLLSNQTIISRWHKGTIGERRNGYAARFTAG